MKHLILSGCLLAGICSSSTSAVVMTELGNVTTGSFPGFVDGDVPSLIAVGIAQGGQPSPFDTGIGADALFGTNFTATWVFNYSTPPVGEVVSGASLRIGIVDHDSAASGDQVALLMLDSSDLTVAANAAFEATGGMEAQYNEYTFALPSTTFADLSDGNATVTLNLAGPGQVPDLFGGGIVETANNGAFLINSTLTVITSVPEPSSLTLLGALSLFAAVRRRRSA